MGPFWLPQSGLSGSFLRSCAIGLFAVATAASASAQTIDVTPAHLAVVEGSASLERDGRVETVNGGMPFVPGDRLRTEAGRAEILFPDGSALDVDEFTSIDLMSPTLLRVTSGRVLLAVYGAGNPSSAVRYQIDTPAASATTDGPGEYRISLFNAPALQTELAVTRGYAALSNEGGTTPLRAGERALADEGRGPSSPQLFNSARFDAFDRWVAAQRGDRTGVAASSQYLPNDLQVYSNDFDRYGSWGYDTSYGNVWYPAVSTGWRPYYNGYWSSIQPYGWTWIGFDRWSWATHHYGRWGYHSNRWFWVPAPRWAPAYVSWGVAPGYVSWCPLGFNNQPVFALSVGFGNFWTGWTAVPRAHFARGYVNQWAVAPDRLGVAPFARSVMPPVPVPPVTRAVPRVVVNGSRGGAVAPSAFDNRAQIQPRDQIRQRNPDSSVGSGFGRTAASDSSPFPARNPNAVGVPRSPSQGSTRTGGWVVPRQPGTQQPIVRPEGQENLGPGGQPVVRPRGQDVLGPGGQPVVRPRNPYAPSIANPYGRQTEVDTTPRWNAPGAAAPQNPQPPSIAPAWNGRQQNSNGESRRGSAVPRTESNNGGQQRQDQSNAGGQQQQQANGGGQSSNGGGAQAGAARQAPSGGGARQRHP